MPDDKTELQHAYSPQVGILQGAERKKALMSIQEVGAPFLVGSVCAGTLAAAIGYGLARGVWRYFTVRRLLRRRRKSQS